MKKEINEEADNVNHFILPKYFLDLYKIYINVDEDFNKFDSKENLRLNLLKW